MGANDQEYSVTEYGTYSVEVTNGGICTTESEGIMIVGISELAAETILLYPNSMTDVAYLEFEGSSQKTIRLLDSQGREVRAWENVSSDRIEIQRGELAAGNYMIQITQEFNVIMIKLLVE